MITQKPKVLIADKMNSLAAEIFTKRGVDVDVKTGLSPEELSSIIGDYEGLAMRSSTTITSEILAAASRMKVIGRAGIGVDNIDVPAATARGVVVMNTPFGNSITTAEHAIAMMFALARQIPQANQSTHEGRWEKSRFIGRELFGKTLGIIGCGNIGAIVANRAIGLHMQVLAFDPFLTDAQAIKIGVTKASLDKVIEQSDFITLHTPLNDKTRGIIGKDALSKMKQGTGIINCARGGLIDEAALKEALDSGHIGGAALDVFEKEPAKDNILFGHEHVICTPHLGASTAEAQVNVAIQVAEQISDFLLTGAVTNALNMPSISKEDAPKLAPYLKLAEQIGSFAGQINQSAVQKITIEYQGAVSALNTKPLTSSILAHFMKPKLESVNMVNAQNIARDKGIELVESVSDKCHFTTAIKLTVQTDNGERVLMGTLFDMKEPRLVMIDGVPIEAVLTPHMLFIRNEDKPGLIGGLGSILADAGQNIADFRLGRIDGSGSAVALVSLDMPLPDDIFQKIKALPQIKRAQRISF